MKFDVRKLNPIGNYILSFVYGSLISGIPIFVSFLARGLFSKPLAILLLLDLMVVIYYFIKCFSRNKVAV